MRNMTQRDALITKNYIFWPIKKSIFKIEIFSSEIEVKKVSFTLENTIALKMQNMTERDALITKKYILAHQKSIFKIEIFFV